MKQFLMRGVLGALFLPIYFCSAVIDHPEYLYPVGQVIFENTKKIAVLYQKGTYLEMLLWDPLTHKAIKGLSHYTPAGLTVQPSQTGVSFIDNQQVRIKELAKKSPKLLDLYPLYDFSLLYWIDDANFYCSARERAHYNLFHVADGDFYRLTRSTTHDYTYPQKINGDLFYLKRDIAGFYVIERTVYPVTALQKCVSCSTQLELTHHLDSKTLELITKQEDASKLCLLEKGEIIFQNLEKEKALSWLTMKNEQEGFFLKHLDYPFIERFAEVLAFECWQLKKSTDGWKTNKLFTFELPLRFLYGERRLYESGLRLFPLYNKDDMYYISANEQGFLDVYRYNSVDSVITCMTQSAQQEHYYFTPCIVESRAYYGGMVLSEEESTSSGPTMFLDKDGAQILIFPYFEI